MTVAELQKDKDKGECFNYEPMTLAMLKSLGTIGCDLYIINRDKKPTLYRAQGIAITPEDFEKLEQRGTKALYVNKQSFVGLQSQLHKRLEVVLKNEKIAPQERYGVMQTAVSAEIESAFRMINVNAAVEKSVDVGEKIAGLLSGGKTVMTDLFQIVRHDYYTFTHVTNVAGYAVLLAEKIGITDQSDLNAIATGGLMHDLGKRMISPAILNKSGKLTNYEFGIIKKHPQLGYEELYNRSDVSHGQLMMVYQHHEKNDGSGYPVGVEADEIHLWAKICAVVDIFDAMTCTRPYRKALSVSFVLDHIGEMAGKQLDKEIVECLISTMKDAK